MTLAVELVEQSFAAVVPQGTELANTFYRHLFADFPQVRPLFSNVDMAEQKQKLLASLKLAVGNLRRPETLLPALEELGARHVDYGAKEAHYPAVGQTLLKSLAEVGGDEWSDATQEAWAEAYDQISAIMIRGSLVPVA